MVDNKVDNNINVSGVSDMNDNISYYQNMPVIPVFDAVIYPGLIVPVFIARDFSVKAYQESIKNYNGYVVLALQKNVNDDNPHANDLNSIGSLVRIRDVINLPDNVAKLVISGENRIVLNNKTFDNNIQAFRCDPVVIKSYNYDSADSIAMMRIVKNKFEQYVALGGNINNDVYLAINSIDDPLKYSDIIASYTVNDINHKQDILEELDVYIRLAKICEILEPEIIILSTEQSIKKNVKTQVEKNHREHYLHEQLKAIYKELNSMGKGTDAMSLYDKMQCLAIPVKTKQKIMQEFDRLKVMNSMSAEYSILHSYLTFLSELPWKSARNKQINIENTRRILDRDHYGMCDLKQRIIEFLVSQKRSTTQRGNAICFVGPPGIGKTSLAKSIAEAMGRPFVSVMLGGLRDESEIKGHRRAYIGAMPGRIMKAIRHAGASNPVILLDEIDKVMKDARHDVSAVLLELLDPDQAATFSDHYVEFAFDLSNVFFIATANSLNIPLPLRDRMDIIMLEGYSETEKIHIAQKHIVPAMYKKYDIRNNEINISQSALKSIIKSYTMESGVRALRRTIEQMIRKGICMLESDKKGKKIAIKASNIKRFVYNAHEITETRNTNNMVGVISGLAWTEYGGKILHIESVMFAGNGKLSYTGALGDVMKESFQAASCYIRSHASALGIHADRLNKYDIHIHVPEGAVPKDGPSAGCAVVMSILSTLWHHPIKCDIAISGELTLMGKILPVGGIKDKILAGIANKFNTIILPKNNKKDVDKMNKKDIENVSIIYCEYITDAFQYIFERYDSVNIKNNCIDLSSFDECTRDMTSELSHNTHVT